MAHIHIPTNYVPYVFQCEHCNRLNGPKLANLLTHCEYLPTADSHVEIKVPSYEVFKGKCSVCGFHQSWEALGLQKRLFSKVMPPLVCVGVALCLSLFLEPKELYLALSIPFVAWTLAAPVIEGIKYGIVRSNMARTDKRNKVFLSDHKGKW